MLSPFTNTLTCRRTTPRSSRTRWPTPGWTWARAASTFPTVVPATSTRRRPAAWPERAAGRWIVGIDHPSGHHGGLDADHRGEPLGKGLPALPLVGGGEQLPGAGPEVEAGRVEPVAGEAVAEHGQPGVALGQPGGQRLPGVAGVPGPVDAGLAVGGAAELVGVQRDDPGGVGVAGVGDHGEAEVARHPVGHVLPVVAAVVAAVQAPVVLEVQPVRPTAGPGDLVGGPPPPPRGGRRGTPRRWRWRSTSGPGRPGRAGRCAGRARRRPAPSAAGADGPTALAPARTSPRRRRSGTAPPARPRPTPCPAGRRRPAGAARPGPGPRPSPRGSGGSPRPAHSSSAPGRPSTAPPPPSAHARSRPAAGAARPARRTGWRTPARHGSAARSTAICPARGRPRTATRPSWCRRSAGRPRPRLRCAPSAGSWAVAYLAPPTAGTGPDR